MSGIKIVAGFYYIVTSCSFFLVFANIYFKWDDGLWYIPNIGESRGKTIIPSHTVTEARNEMISNSSSLLLARQADFLDTASCLEVAITEELSRSFHCFLLCHLRNKNASLALLLWLKVSFSAVAFLKFLSHPQSLLRG